MASAKRAGETDPEDDIEIGAEPMLDDDNVMLTISCRYVLMNVHANPREWQALPTVRLARASDRTDVRLGTCTGTPVWWSVEGEDLNVGVGSDVETCDIALALPLTTLGQMIQAIADASKDEWS